MSESTLPFVCDHDSKCSVCVTCTICYPHEPGWWEPEGIAGPCPDACLLRQLNNFETIEGVLQEVAGRTQVPRDKRKAEHLLGRIGTDRDRMLGTEDL